MIAPLDRYTLPQVLEVLASRGSTPQHLGEWLLSGRLRAECYPFVGEPERAVAIDPHDWHDLFRDAYEFSVHYGWFGNEDLSGLGRQDPQHVLPASVAHLKGSLLDDGRPVVTTAVAYVERAELNRFLAWLDDEARGGSREDLPSAKRTGRRPSHNYKEIDQVLAKILMERGAAAFRDSPAAIRHLLVQELGGAARAIPASTLDKHIKAFVGRRRS